MEKIIKTIAKLLKFMIKVLTKVIEKGTKVIEAYELAQPKVSQLTLIIKEIKEIITRLEEKKAELERE